MHPQAMEPFGKALLAYFEGNAGAEILVRRNDGKENALPAILFFRDGPRFTEIERAAIALCEGRVLDIGAGAGSLSLELQRLDHPVTAIDISPDAVEVARRRGVRDTACADAFAFAGGPYDTLLMMGHGIGMVETIDGLGRFLSRAHTLLAPGGRMIVDSLDVRVTSDPDNLAYHAANRAAGRYVGETRLRFEFGGLQGDWCGWLHVDAETLRGHAEAAGWRFEVIRREESGDYLAWLSR